MTNATSTPMTIDEALASIDPPPELIEITLKALPLILTGEYSQNSGVATIKAIDALPERCLMRLVELAFNDRTNCTEFLRGKIFRMCSHAGMSTFKRQSAKFSHSQIFDWLQRTKPIDRMFQIEYDAFLQLPEIVRIYRGVSHETTPEEAAKAFCWSPDVRVARRYAHHPRNRELFPLVVSALIPRTAVFAFNAPGSELGIDGQTFWETELIVDYRQVSNVKSVRRDWIDNIGNPTLDTYNKAQRAEQHSARMRPIYSGMGL